MASPCSSVVRRAGGAGARGRALWLAAVLAGAALSARAQPAPRASAVPPAEPIAALRADADGDFVPDRLGEVVALAGRATTGAGTGPLRLYVEDATGGMLLEGARAVQPVAAGDSVRAYGALRQRKGQTYLEVEGYAVERGAAAPVAAHALAAPLPPLEAYEGRLVKTAGTIVGVGSVAAGTYVNLLVGDTPLVVFVFEEDRDAYPLSAYTIGAYLTVTGALGQYDSAPPFDGGYQVYPRAPDDLRVSGRSPTFYRNLALGAGALLLLALSWIGALHREVRRRVRQHEASEQRYRLLFEHAGDPVMVHTPDAAAETRLLEYNRAAAATFSHPLDAEPDAEPDAERQAEREGAARTLIDYVAADDAAALDAHLREAAAAGSALSEVQLVTRRGATVPFELLTHRLVLDGAPRLLSIARDVSQRKRYERALIEARDEAESLARSKMAFLASMSHEIRTPLTAVIGFSEVLAEEVGADQRDLVQLIRDGAGRLLAMLNATLELARMDAKRYRLAPQPLDLVAVVEENVRLLGTLAEQRGLTLRFATPLAACPVVHDPMALDRLLHNLVGNALKFTPEGGVTVSLEAAPEGDALRLRVADTGIGIDADFLPRLFDAFEQATAAQSHTGSGLGLALTKGLVEQMGGRIEVESEVGVGTTFTITLPRLSPPGSDGDAAPTRPAAEAVTEAALAG